MQTLRTPHLGEDFLWGAYIGYRELMACFIVALVLDASWKFYELDHNLGRGMH
jgi:hypothetical protein